MKIRKNIFSSLNLILFISSFVFSTFNLLAAEPATSASSHSQYHFVNKHGVDGNTCTQVVFEENENENEKNEHVSQSLVLTIPFYISFFQFEASPTNPFTSQLAAVTAAKPIYLAVGNFRI